jgi:hypothetical protein
MTIIAVTCRGCWGSRANAKERYKPGLYTYAMHPFECTNTEAELLDVIGTKVLRFFLFAIHSHLY